MLEEQGIVSAAEAGQSRQVLVADEPEAGFDDDDFTPAHTNRFE
jgi:hypothetical protein